MATKPTYVNVDLARYLWNKYQPNLTGESRVLAIFWILVFLTSFAYFWQRHVHSNKFTSPPYDAPAHQISRQWEQRFWSFWCWRTYIHTYIYIHTDIHTYIQTYRQTFFQPIGIASIAILHMAVWKLKIQKSCMCFQHTFTAHTKTCKKYLQIFNFTPAWMVLTVTYKLAKIIIAT